MKEIERSLSAATAMHHVVSTLLRRQSGAVEVMSFPGEQMQTR